MKKRKIFITENDKRRLEELVGVAEHFGNKQRQDLTLLSSELARANIVSSKDMPADIVTMNSKIRLKDMESNEEMTYTLVFPQDANIAEGAISILAPVGTAILGYSKNDIISWPVPDGVRKFRIEKILYQPEAAGDFHL